MKIIGIHYSTNGEGKKVSTLHVSDNFNDYYSNAEAGRGCVGQKADTVYVGNFDCSHLKVGMEIDICYDKAITTAKGTFQPIKRIDILK
ncbi:hypothetical protein D7V86_10500 [bacterium D16-51]|nr:hypothetical protein D7V96_10475 [bacterium D16-59]RKI60082.1 hypothetical protein D7V86_10500 [bacterium D16-51]